MAEHQVKNDPLSNVISDDHFRPMPCMGARWQSRELGLGKWEALHLELGGRLQAIAPSEAAGLQIARVKGEAKWLDKQA